MRLIVVTDADLAAPRSVLEVVEIALAAGAPAVQLRDKRATAQELLTTGRELREATSRTGALFFVNDRVDVALTLGADGVHLGPHDLSVAAARRAAGADLLIGRSADDRAVARAAVADGVDYIGCGTVYATSTKGDAGQVIGLGGLDAVARAVEVPVVGIGGITVERSAEVAETAACGVAVVGAVMGADDPAGAVRALLAPWSEHRRSATSPPLPGTRRPHHP